MNTRLKRLLLLEQRYGSSVNLFNETQLRVLQSLRIDAEGTHIDAPYPGALFNWDALMNPQSLDFCENIHELQS